MKRDIVLKTLKNVQHLPEWTFVFGAKRNILKYLFYLCSTVDEIVPKGTLIK